MNMFGNGPASDSSDVREPGQGDSLQMIPVWSIVLAIAVFVGSMYFFNRAPAPRPAPNPTASTPSPAAPSTASAAATTPAQTPRRPQQRGAEQVAGRLMFIYTTSAALASYVLLVGYVSRDVKRRNMSAPLWMMIVVVANPGFIGAVVYFLLRQPISIRCPNCTTELTAGVHFCPQCRFQVAPVCGQCFRGVRITDAFCPQCGHDVTEDHVPARLRAYSDG
jgi:hypothetical protein